MPVPSQGHYGFHSFRLLTDFLCLYTYEFWLSLCRIVRSSVIVLLCPPNEVWETYCVCSVSYYYYVTPNAVGWRIAILRFFFTIIIIILIIILLHIFVRSISRRCLDQTLWNLVEISYAMWSCAGKGWFFRNGCRCHGNEQNDKKLKNTNMIIAGYSLNRNWCNLTGTTSTASETR
jgi:hypothetical protein